MRKIGLTLTKKSKILQVLQIDRGSLAQLVEHFTFNEGVDGSNPSRATISVFCTMCSHRLAA